MMGSRVSIASVSRMELKTRRRQDLTGTHLGVAGGELLIPTLVLLFGVNIKLAGSLSLAVSLPTMIVGFTRYSRDRSFIVLRQNWAFVVVMAAGSMIGAAIGGRLLGIVPAPVLLPILSILLIVSSVKVWQHR